MNILFVNHTPFNPSYGGIERVTDVLSRTLAQNYGHQIFHLFETIVDNRMLNYDYPATLIQLTQSNNIEEKKIAVKKIVLSHKIDVIINQRGQNPELCYILKHDSARLINVIHGQPKSFLFTELHKPLILIDTFFGRIKYLIKITTSPIYRVYRKYLLKKEISDWFKCSLASCDKFILLSDKDKEELKRYIHIDENHKIIGIPNPNTFDSYTFDSSKKEKIILYVARLSKLEKNPMRIVKVWEKLYEKFPEWRLIIVGEGECKSSLNRYIKRHHIERIKLAGKQKNVSQFYEKSDFICLTSNIEGWGMTLTEGMQFGCIPITFNSYGGASDIIDDSINGCLISPFDIDEYAMRLSELMGNDIKRRATALATIEKVKQFDVSIIVQQWDSLIKSL